MDRLRKVRLTRQQLAFGLTIALIAVAEAVFLLVRVPLDTAYEVPSWHVQAGTSAVLVGIAYAMRRRPGVTAAILAFAGALLAQPLDSAWNASASLALFADPPTGPRPIFWLSSLQVLAHTTLPATIGALYATARDRSLGRWTSGGIWLLVAGTVFAAVARGAFEGSIWPPDSSDPWWYQGDSLAARFDDQLVLMLIGSLALLGALRRDARRHISSSAAPGPSPRKVNGPSRAIVIAIVGGAILWVPASLAFLSRPGSEDLFADDVTRFVALPVLLLLVGLVVSRWSRMTAWLAVSAAFQTTGALVFYRAIGEYVSVVPADATGAAAAGPPLFVTLVVVGALVEVLAFGAIALSLEAVTDDGSAPASRARTWAVRGAIAGIALQAWFISVGIATSGIPWGYELTLMPIYPVGFVVLGLGLWRRLVPAVAEAENVATRPFQPLRYLETAVSEAISGGAEHRRRAVETERARLASTLHAEFLPNLERLASQNAAGATREEVTERLQELQDEVRRMMAERRLVVLEEFGIVEALEWLVAQAEERGSFEVELAVDDASTTERPPREVERAAFRIAQLAVENAIQHAGPSRLRLHVLARRDRLTIAVADDGTWVAPSPTDRRRDHVGIADMRSEADHVRGAVEVTPSRGGGTTVQFGWPAVAPTPAPARTPAPPTPASGTAG